MTHRRRVCGCPEYMFIGQVKNACSKHSYTYTPRNTYAIIEYRIHRGENGDSHDIEFLEGKEWRTARKLVAKCEEGEDTEEFGLTIQWVERVERWHDQEGQYMEDDDYEIMWSRDESERRQP